MIFSVFSNGSISHFLTINIFYCFVISVEFEWKQKFSKFRE